MGTLYECLKEARLEKYYPTLRVNGITRSEALARLNPEDCDAIGVTSPEDKRRLTDLINIIKSVHDSDPLPASSVPRQSPTNARRPVLKRNRSPANRSSAIQSNQIVGRGLTPTSNVRVVDLGRSRSSPSQAQALDLTSDEEESSTESSDQSDYEPASKHINAASPPLARKTAINRVKQKGYNYGVPNPVSSSVRSSRSSGRQAGEEKIKVCVRKRPLNKKEVKAGETDIAVAESTTTLTINEPKLAVDLTPHTLQHEFMFDEVFDETCSNEDVYIRAARPLINCIFDGGSATCFAYGQTGAGKTHTMIGSREIPGLYLLASHDIFSIIESGKYGRGIKVWVSYFEIYCGQLFDLLNKRNRLHAREDGSHKVCIAGLTETEASDVTSLLQILEYGNSVRSKGATGVNPDSSRSHAILQMEIRNSEDRRLGRMSFIDLAGSERASDVTDTDRQTRMEGAEINQSLLALKECIRSIDQESKHKPFRQSKLTHILKDSFVGNSRTCMIANISPIQSSCEHTLNTLRYADRVKELRKETGASGMRSSTASNILMNIPLTTPSVFQPANILCSSTPIKPKATRHTASRSSMQDIQLDPNETPIKGHGVKRRTKPVSSSNSGAVKPQIRKPSATVASRLAVVRHVPSPTAELVRVTPKSRNTEPSDSDHTDSDSCNISEKVNKMKDNVPVIKSTDTENDFQTTDFNNDDEMNDLNRTDGKSTSDVLISSTQTASVVTVSNKGVRLSSSGHPLPVVDGVDHRVYQSAHHEFENPSGYTSRPSPPILRKKTYPDSSNQSSSTRTDSVPKKVDSQHSQVRDLPLQNNYVTNSNNHVPRVSEIKNNNVSKPTFQHAPVSIESVPDDMLFDSPAATSPNSARTPRTPSTGDMNSLVLGLSRGNNMPLKIPQDPTLDPVLPAVMTAKSSDLTTFSQRSPSRFGRYQHEPPPPPFPLAVVNPTESRPRILRTPPPMENNPVDNYSLYTPPSSSSKPKVLKDHPPNEHDEQYCPLPQESRHLHSNNNANYCFQEETDKFPQSEQSQNTQTEQQREFVAKKRMAFFGVNEEKNDGVNAVTTQGNLFNNKENNSILSKDEKVTTALEENPLSTNEWYNTPAHHAMHIVSSVQKSANLDLDNYQTNHSQRPNCEKPEKPFEADKDIQDKTDTNLTEFLPIKKRLGVHDDKPASSRKDVASRLRSVFFKDSPKANSVSSAFKLHGSASRGSHEIVEETKVTEYGMPQRNDIPSVNELKKETGKTSHETRRWIDISDNNKISHGLNNSAIKTEKLEGGGSTFLPIHPQPVTSVYITKNVVEPANQDMLQPVPKESAEQMRMPVTDTQQEEQRTKLISAHEEQLATVTSLCKQEMKLLLGAKAGHKSDGEYIRKISHILTQKIEAIQLLQEKIETYQISETNQL